jgi:hypothetical protein
MRCIDRQAASNQRHAEKGHPKMFPSPDNSRTPFQRFEDLARKLFSVRKARLSGGSLGGASGPYGLASSLVHAEPTACDRQASSFR